MTDDLIKRLRDARRGPLIREAADALEAKDAEIERLRAAVKSLRISVETICEPEIREIERLERQILKAYAEGARDGVNDAEIQDEIYRQMTTQIAADAKEIEELNREIERLRGICKKSLDKLVKDGARPGWGVVKDWLAQGVAER